MVKTKTDVVDPAPDLAAPGVDLPLVRHPFSRTRSVITCLDAGRTHQSHKEACDVNNIVARFDRTGYLPPSRGEGQYMDVTGLQGRSHAEMIEESRTVAARAADGLANLEAQAKEAAAKKHIDLETEIARLKAENEALQGGKP